MTTPSDESKKVDSKTTNKDEALARAHVDGPAHPPAVENAPQLQKTGRRSAIMAALLEDPELVPAAIAAIKSALGANQMFYDKHSKEWTAEPDARTRLAAAQLMLHYLEGLPVQRIETKSMHTDTTPQAWELLLEKSPAMREQLRRMLDAADKRAA